MLERTSRGKRPMVLSEEARQPNGGVQEIARNEAGVLTAKFAGCGEVVEDVRVARCFPWSLPEVYISLRDKDGKELALLETLAELDGESRRIVEAELEQTVFNPKILRVVSHKREFGVTNIVAETDRGEVTFQIRSRDDIRILSPTRALFRDADGNTYELPDLEALDGGSRRHLRHYF